MSDPDRLQRLEHRLHRVFLMARQSHYPEPEDLTYIADVAGCRAIFLTDDRYGHGFFYPRYSGGKLHEPVATRWMMDRLTGDSVVIDVGAHLGYFSILAGLRAKTVFAVEPMEFLIPRLHKNIAANHLGNVHTIMAAAGAAPGLVSVPKVGVAGTRITPDPSPSGNALVPVLRLDDHFGGAHAPTLLKIDTEGFELDVLMGMTGLLEAGPDLIVEIHRTMTEFGRTPAELHAFLTERGYRILGADHRDPTAEPVDIGLETLQNLDNAMVFCTRQM